MSTGRLKQHLSWLFRGLASGGITSTSGPCSPSCPQVLPTPLAQRFCRSASADAPLPGSSGAASKLGQTLVRDQLPRLPVCPGRLLMHHAASRMAVPAPAVGPCLDRWASLALSRGCQSSSIPRRAPRQHATAADLALYWGAAAVAMIGVSYAMVPIYKIFCAATGYGGAVKGAKTVEEKMRKRLEKPDEKVEQAAAQREITVWFNGDVAEGMKWEFQPTQQCVRVHPGQSTLVFFTAKNTSDQSVTGYSVYNVTPDKAAIYFNKIQCFCFEEQRLRANEEVDMPVLFYLDPEIATDWNCRNIDNITLSYMFHKVDDADLDDYEDDGAPTIVKVHSGPHAMGGGAHGGSGSGMQPSPGSLAPAVAPAH